MVAEVAESAETVQRCKTRRLTVWPNKCGCPDCHPKSLRMMKINRVGAYRRIEPADAHKVLDRFIALGYDANAAWSAINYPGLSVNTVHGWLAARRQGYDLKIGPGGCQVIVNAGQPTTGRMNLIVAQRKLRALARMGYPASEIARETGVSKRTLQSIASGITNSIAVEVNAAVNAVFRKLVTVPAPDDRIHNVIRVKARQARWVSAMDWDDIDDPACVPDRSDLRTDGIDESRHFHSVDPSVVEALVAGRKDGVRPTKAERIEVVRILLKRGKTHGEISRLTGIGHPERYYRKGGQ